MIKTSEIETIPRWFLPSFYGDIRLTATGDRSCSLIKTSLTAQEKTALIQFTVIAKKKAWTDIDCLSGSGPIALDAPIAKVSKVLAKLMKPGRTTISAVRFSDGTMEEIRSTDDDSDTGADTGPKEDPASSGLYRDEGPGEKVPKKRGRPKAAATVAAPIRGCPAPDFTSSELRAQEVLAAFLDPGQLEDFRRYNKFVSIGQTTGNRYMITSRHARDELAKYTRSLYDLDRETPLCVHDWDVPAAEEMLTLHVLLQLPGWENYLRTATEDNLEDVLSQHLGAFDDGYKFVNEMDTTDPERGISVSPFVAAAARRGLI